MQNWFERVLVGARGCFVGVWLGFLTRKLLHCVDEEYYTRTKRAYNQYPGEHDYHSNEWNLRGLLSWEERALNSYFRGCERLLLLGAGGGREVLALRRLGYLVDAFEPHPDLVDVANELLQAEGYEPSVHVVPRNEAPTNTGKEYDGIIIGWGMYMHIQGKKHRIALLRQLRAKTHKQCPILLSFMVRRDPSRSYKLARFMANMVGGPLRHEPAEIGDWLTPEYIHLFTEAEIAYELAEGGFRLVYYNTDEYGHAVGTAV